MEVELEILDDTGKIETQPKEELSLKYRQRFISLLSSREMDEESPIKIIKKLI